MSKELIERMTAELDKYKRAYLSADRQILSLKEQRNRLTDERDELKAQLAKYQNLEPVAYMCEEDPERESAFAWTHGICPGCGNYRVPLYALEK